MARAIVAIFATMILFPEIIGYRNVYVDERGPSSKVMCDAIHRLPFEPGGLNHVKGAWKFLYADDPTAPATATATAPPKLELCDPDGSKCKLPHAR